MPMRKRKLRKKSLNFATDHPMKRLFSTPPARELFDFQHYKARQQKPKPILPHDADPPALVIAAAFCAFLSLLVIFVIVLALLASLLTNGDSGALWGVSETPLFLSVATALFSLGVIVVYRAFFVKRD